MVAGFGGQGVMTMGKLLAEATCDATDLNVSFFPSYGAAQRGGTANCFVVISDEEIGAPVSYNLEDLIVMNGPSLHAFIQNVMALLPSDRAERSPVLKPAVRGVTAWKRDRQRRSLRGKPA